MCTSDARPVARTAELLAEGWRTPQIRTAVRSGALVRLRQGVYALAHACEPVRAAARHGGGIACETAARHLGIWVLPQPGPAPHVWMRGHGHRRGCSASRSCGCVEHWDDSPQASSLSMPSVPRILRQLYACHGIECFFAAVESARNLGLLDGAGMRWLRRTVNARGREAVALSRADAQSGLESLLRWRLRDLRIRVRTQVPIAGVGIVDVLLGDRLIIELDGAGNHGSAEHRGRDLRRDANAALWGYVTLRFDYGMVVHDWELVEAAIRGQLDSGRHQA